MTIDGIFEQKKFDSRREPFRKYLNELQNSDYEITEILEHFPAFVGHMTLLRCLTIYELYKKTEGIAGHIADVGVFKGGSAILFSKLIIY